MNYVRKRVLYTDEILNHMNTVPQTVEMTRLYGVDFESVLTRGSQFKIESVLIRVAKANDILLLSASKVQVAHQEMRNSCPMIMEPPKPMIFEYQILIYFPLDLT